MTERQMDDSIYHAKLHRVGQKTGPLCFMVCIFISDRHQIWHKSKSLHCERCDII